MATENSYEPSGVCIGDTALDNTPSGFALFQAIGGHYTSPAQAIEELVDNAISSIRANGGSGKVILCLTDGGDYVDISVCDSGTGISDLGAALTISGCGGAQTPLNEHGCGLKNALSYLSEEDELWLLESRTKEDAAADRYRCVSAPYAAIDWKMRAKIHQGNGAILHETGTTIRVRCGKEKFECLKPATKRAKADFRQLCGYLKEELAYTYASILAEGRITIGVICREQNAPESYHQLEALEPLWEEDPVELPETPADFGGGKLTVRCRYGTIEADKENATYYYKGNMASSGLQHPHALVADDELQAIRRRCAAWSNSSTASATPRESRTTSSSRPGRKRASAHDVLSGDRCEGDGGEHPPPPDRERVHGFGHAAVPEPRVSSVRVSLAGGTDAAEHR